VGNPTHREDSVSGQWSSGWRSPCCGSYHPVSLRNTLLINIILILIIVVFVW
jgi:hypothetical protein